MSATLPQFGYFERKWRLPGTDVTITGHSKAMERTGFLLEPLGVVLDAGIDLPLQSSLAGNGPRAILVTHGHIDHSNALPMLLRHMGETRLFTHVFAPVSATHRLRQFCQLSWQIKVEITDEVPDEYAAPPEDERDPEPNCELCNPCRPSCLFRPVVGGGSAVTIDVGKKGSQQLEVHPVTLFHRCNAVGYVLRHPAKTSKRLRPELIGETKKETADNVKAARARGEDAQIEELVPARSLLAYVLDTTIEALEHDVASGGRKILTCPNIVIECTYLEDDKHDEAVKRGHIYWGALRPYVAASARGDHGEPSTFILCHFSLRYTEEGIKEFFEDPGRCGVRVATREAGLTRRPDLVLWLDMGLHELWVLPVLEIEASSQVTNTDEQGAAVLQR